MQVKKVNPIMIPKYVECKGIRTRYFEAGSGEPLVLVHGGHYGMYGGAYAWSLNFAGLSKQFHVYAFDKLGMGFTDNPKSDSDYTIEATLDHAKDFLDVMGLKKVHLLGVSRGAFLVARLTIDHPELVKSLIILDSNTLAPDDPVVPVDFYDKLEASAPKTETRESVMRAYVANSYSGEGITEDFIEDVYETAYLPKTIEARRKMDGLYRTLFLPGLDKKRIETIELIKAGRIKVPTLIIWGRNDPSAPLKLGLILFDLFAKNIPRTELHVFNQSGHVLYREHPEEFNHELSNFLTSL